MTYYRIGLIVFLLNYRHYVLNLFIHRCLIPDLLSYCWIIYSFLVMVISTKQFIIIANRDGRNIGLHCETSRYQEFSPKLYRDKDYIISYWK